MKRLLLTAGFAALFGPALGMPLEERPAHIRVWVEYIDAPHETVTALMQSKDADSGPKLHARLRALVKEKKARIVETSIVLARPGQKATVESITEYIYPTEYEPPELPNSVGMDLISDWAKGRNFVRPHTPPAFETRNVGVTLEIEPNIGANEEIIDLRFAPEIVDLLRLETWLEYVDQWGDASQKMPVFGSMRVNTTVSLQRGKFSLVGFLTPTRKEGGQQIDRKILLFVRADIVRIVDPDKEEER